MKLDIFEIFISKILNPSKQNLSEIEYIEMSRYCDNLLTLGKNCSSPCVSYVIFFITVLII